MFGFGYPNFREVRGDGWRALCEEVAQEGERGGEPAELGRQAEGERREAAGGGEQRHGDGLSVPDHKLEEPLGEVAPGLHLPQKIEEPVDGSDRPREIVCRGQARHAEEAHHPPAKAVGPVAHHALGKGRVRVRAILDSGGQRIDILPHLLGEGRLQGVAFLDKQAIDHVEGRGIGRREA